MNYDKLNQDNKELIDRLIASLLKSQRPQEVKQIRQEDYEEYPLNDLTPQLDLGEGY